MAENDREQRTEEATPRRRSEARDRGQVPISTDLISSVGLTAGAGALALGGPKLAGMVAEGLRDTLQALPLGAGGDLDVRGATGLLEASVRGVAGVLGMIIAPTVLACALVGYAQVGFHLAPKAMELDPSKLDPVKGLQRIFSLRGLARTVLSSAKVLLITAVAAAVAWSHVQHVVHAGINELGPLLAALGVVVFRMTAAVMAVVLALAVVDLFFQRFQHERDLRMTRAEVKEEHRMTEGDPHVRARIRSMQREVAMRRMMADVPKATVVVTNPTHYAVALRYEREAPEESRRAPVVLAKGVDHMAERIKEIARESGVTCHEDVPLARALHARVAIGQEIPEELYGAVAAVLAAVYRVREARAS